MSKKPFEPTVGTVGGINREQITGVCVDIPTIIKKEKELRAALDAELGPWPPIQIDIEVKDGKVIKAEVVSS